MAAFLEVVDLRKAYGSVKALDGVSFSVREGELFGLLGPNGAGKTTLLSVLSCLLEPTSGEVRLQGRRLHRGEQWVRRLIGVVPQELALYGDLTARENLHFFGELYGLRGAALRERVNAVLAAVALEDKANDRVHTFSGGMKRRLNLGAALVHEPRLLLLDEPTVGVDPQSRNHIFEEVRRLNAAGVTILYTSHYMEEVQTLCPRVGIMDHGRLAACGAVPDLLRQLHGLIRIRVPRLTPGLRDRLKDLPDCFLSDPEGWRHERDAGITTDPVIGAVPGPTGPEGRTLELNCRDVKATLVRVVAILNELKVELISLETEEPNLERVFLHLTGRELRD
jgi:linearmycin/streptolysin S transport system ATP-binding protein